MTPTPRAPGAFPGTQSTEGLLPPSRAGKDGRSLSAASLATIKGQSYGRTGPPPGSFTAELKSTISRNDMPRSDRGAYGAYEETSEDRTSEQRQADYRDKIEKETKIKVGSENLLEALNAKNAKQTRDQRKLVESELNTSNRKIAQLRLDLEAEIQKSKEERVSPQGRLSQLFRAAPARAPSNQSFPEANGDAGIDTDSESPTYILAEILQALEAEDLPSDYYVGHANELVELFKRHPTLKYDLAWSIFGLRMQLMLLSDSREVVAAAYRVLRYAVTDRKSLQTIRALQTDYLVILSLVKDSKASVEREQALKFVRAFLDVKDGAQEIHPAVARIVVAVAEHVDDRLRSIAVLTIAELLIRDPLLVVNAGGISTLAEAMGNGVYHAPETLIGPLLHLVDLPARRGLLRSGFEFSTAFASFTEPSLSHAYEERLKASSKVIAALFKSWSGLVTLSLHDFLGVRSVVSSLYIATVPVRTATLDLLIEILRIKPPSWSSSFIGGRRLTTYGRVTNLKTEPQSGQDSARDADDDARKRSLIEHFTAVILAVLLRTGLLTALMHAEKDSPSFTLKRKTNLLIAEVLKMASELLPSGWSAELQTLPRLFESATSFDNDERFQAVATVYQVDSVNRTLYRSISGQSSQGIRPGSAGIEQTSAVSRARATSKSQITASIDEAQFRGLLLETQVLNTVNYIKWRWDLIQPIIEGPLLNPKRLDEAMRATKFVHRLLGFLRPFKFRFSDASNTKPNQRYVRAGCALVQTLLQTQEGAKYLAENKLVRQIAECLAQFDRLSGITSAAPLFSPERLSETLVGGYFAILGVMCSDPKGLQMMERWKIINMFYHIIELKDRDDLIRALLTNLDYTLDSHPRIILSKALISGSKQIRINATRILRKYATRAIEPGIVGGGAAEWAIKLLVTQLYDPEIEVCEIAIKILEEACNNLQSLEYVVRCRPALDHLGEIGAPLLLRFLSTSVGYHYLDGLDYITKEMDDWFLGRNDSYVTLVEASLARALSDAPLKPQSSFDEHPEPQDFGSVPPHFYRELTRTSEGCELLKSKGHFEEFAATIQDFGMDNEDIETILKVKGCLWAVGNVGSMELGAPFLERTNIIKHIVEIAEESEVLTLRGTAFFVLGLISRSLHGQEILAEYGWDGTVNVMGESLGYSLPLQFTKLFYVESLTASAQTAQSLIPSRRGSITDEDPNNAEILKSVTKLGNTVLSNKAISELNGMKHKKLPGFSKPGLFRKVMSALSMHHYRIPQHRFVMELFDKGVLRRVVLEEDDESDESGSQSSGT